MCISHKTVFHRHRLQTQLERSRGLLGNWLEEEYQTSGVHEAVERSGSYAPPQFQFIVVDGLQ
jgi:hypothetical protein